MRCRRRHMASIRKTIGIGTNRTKLTDRQIATTAHHVTTQNPRQPCNSSRSVYGNDDPSSHRCACSPTPTLSVPPPNRSRRCRIRTRRIHRDPPNRGRDGRRQALQTTMAAASTVPPESPAWTSIVASRTPPGPGGIMRSSPPGTSSWDWQVATARCRCTTRRTSGSTRTCTTIFATTTTTMAWMTEARTTTVWRARLHFREIQESVGFLRNPQDFKNSCRKTKKCSCF